jgi:excisionase family DNA binding protein
VSTPIAMSTPAAAWVPGERAGESLPLPPTVIRLAQAMAEGLARTGRRDYLDGIQQPDDRPPLVDLREAARLLGVSRMTVTRLCDQGRLPCVVVAQGAQQKLRRVPRAFIDAVAAEALAVGGEVDLAEFASAWLARHGGTGADAPGASRALAAVGSGLE